MKWWRKMELKGVDSMQKWSIVEWWKVLIRASNIICVRRDISIINSDTI